MSLKFGTNNSVNRSWISGTKKLFGLFLFLATACMSSAVLAKTDSELRKRLETLEARLLELEGRLESKREQGERNAGGTDHGVGKENFMTRGACSSDLRPASANRRTRSREPKPWEQGRRMWKHLLRAREAGH